MPERDWQKDWELCEQAKREFRNICRLAGGAYVNGVYVTLAPGEILTRFFHEAREGWPAALEERARLQLYIDEALHPAIDRLQQRVKELEEVLQQCLHHMLEECKEDCGHGYNTGACFLVKDCHIKQVIELINNVLKEK